MDTIHGYVGIDVSKDTLDACCISEKNVKSKKLPWRKFSNTPDGHAKLLRWCQFVHKDQPIHFCMESTGSYSLSIAEFLTINDQYVSVENPARVKSYAQSLGVGNKTDKIDARTIALYCRSHNPDCWRMATPEIRELKALGRHAQTLHTSLGQIKNRLADPGLVPSVQCSLEKQKNFLLAEINEIEEQIRNHIDNVPNLKRDKELLLSIPGVGEKLAQTVLSEIADIGNYKDAQAVAAHAGLCPREFKSGSSVNRPSRLSKNGNAHLRRALYMPALSAIRYNPLVKEFFDRLVTRGKARKAALAAAMRKLLMIIYGVLKNQTKFCAQTQP